MKRKTRKMTREEKRDRISGSFMESSGSSTIIKGSIVKIDNTAYPFHSWSTSWTTVDSPMMDSVWWPIDSSCGIYGKKTLQVTKKEDIKFEGTILD